MSRAPTHLVTKVSVTKHTGVESRTTTHARVTPKRIYAAGYVFDRATGARIAPRGWLMASSYIVTVDLNSLKEIEDEPR